MIAEGQMNILDFIDEPINTHKCIECENAKFKERMRNGSSLYYCNVVRAYITEYTIDATFHKNCFKRRSAWKH